MNQLVRGLLGLSILFICTNSFAQTQADTLHRLTAARQFAQTITPEDLRAHLSFLADDLLEGRETGERGQHLAALYLRSQLMRAGLQPGAGAGSYFQPYFLQKIKVEGAEIKIGRTTFSYKTDFFSYAPQRIPESLEGTFVFAGYGLELDDIEVEDKIVLLMAGDRQGRVDMDDLRGEITEWSNRGRELMERGARAAFMALPKEAYRRLVPFARTRTTLVTEEEVGGFPFFFAGPELADKILGAARSSVEDQQTALAANPQPADLDFSRLRFSMEGNVERETQPASNVLGYLPGTDLADEIIVITAHYDHLGVRKDKVYNGADDDGSGSGAVLEVAEAFAEAAQAGYQPRRSILFMWVSGEEKGLLGSEFYVDHAIYPLSQTVVNLNIDMIGRIDPAYADDPDSTNYVFLIGSDKLSQELHQLSERTNAAETDIVLDYRYNDENDPNRYYYRSDHYNFAKNKVPVIFYFTGVHADYHKPTDTADKLHYEKMARITRLVFHTAWEIAQRDSRPRLDSR